MQQTPKPSRRVWSRRVLSLLLSLTLALGLIPVFPADEASAHWADSYLSQLVEWGFIRPDQANYPDRALTRADFMAIVNRAYGYHELGETPFEDVAESDWFYDDVGIAYNARYIKGTSPTTASPGQPLTRETAATILGRNMMLQESPGELLDFTDARQISSWAKGTIKSSLEHYLVSGYDDGTFRPQRNVSWGEMASMVTSLVGTPLQEPGEYALGGVYGNVTITSPNVTLRDTVVSGDLYVSGGVGLGGIVLENVTVLGRIIASGTGQAEGGQSSILLRNVTADELLVDNLQDNYVSVRADGVTEIGRTTVRTSAYIEDNTPDGMGLKYISLEGEIYPEGEEPDGWQPIQLDLAGRIGEVVNRTPGSQVHVGAGTVAKLTVDETAVDSTVVIDRGSVVKELNLDTGVNVTGQGDIEKLVVSAPGSTVEMLPDEIEIRPGITANIAGEEMDTVAAQESSEQPIILAGYPQAQDIVPTGLDAAFMTNKAGTIYWAVTSINDGSVGADDLIKPPSYGNLAVRHGSVKVARGNEETISKITGLTPGGSYYLSAILVDARGQRSTVKVIAFTTPDNTTPAFCTGYPKMSKVACAESVVVVMPNKNCKLYYALMPQGATAPTENELKSASVSGALGYGVRDVTKNVEDAFQVNDVILEEQTTYVLYLWLTDADGVNKGKIVSLTFTTDDETPPWFVSGPTQVKTQATSVSLDFQLSEDGTVYWVAVPTGTQYPKPEPGTSYETAPLDTPFAIMQVVNGMNLGADGKSGRVTAKQGVNGTINISGLKAETVYDLYYVAKDNAGPDRNYSVTVLKMTINTLDDKPPVFTQSFSNSSDGKNPRVDTDIYIDVSEDVLYVGQNGGVSLLELYRQTQTGSASSRAQAVGRLAANLYNSIVLHKYDVQTRREENIYLKYQTGDTRTDWTVDYTQVKVEARREGGIRITFPSSGLQLENGGQYCFIINDLADTSNARNPIKPDTGVDFWKYSKESEAAGHNVPVFVVDLPVVNLDTPIIGSEGPMVRNADGTISESEIVRMDMIFYMEPVSTSTMSDNISYDVLLWSRSTMSYDLYYRIVDHDGKKIDYTSNQDIMLARTANKAVDKNGWMYLGNSGLCNPAALDPKNPNGQKGWSGRSLSAFFNGCDSSQYARLNKLSEKHHYQFVVCLTSLNNGGEDYRTWDDTAYMEVNVAAGQAQNLDQLAGTGGSPSHDKWQEFTGKGIIRGAQSIGNWQNENNQFSDTQLLEREFKVSTLPSFINNTPEFNFNTNGSVSISLNLSSAGTVHYAISEVDPKTGRPAVTTIREMMQGTDDCVVDANGDYTGAFRDDVDIVGNGKEPPQMYITTTGPRPPVKGGSLNEYPMPDWMIGGYPDNTVDDPEGKNKIADPSNLIIVQDKWQNQVVDSGTFTPQEGVNDPVVSDKVKPNTTYFAYFVITSVDNYDNMSHVYIYQFTTPEAMKPSVILDAAGGSGDVTMSIDVATKSAYRVISKSDALNSEKVSILSQPFALYTAHTGNVDTTGGEVTVKTGNFTDGTPENYLTKASGYFTVLDALTTPYRYSTASKDPAPDGNLKNDSSYPQYYYPDWGGDASAYAQGYTVFDMYASDSARDQLYSFIQSGQTAPPEEVHIDNWGPTGSTNTNAPRRGEDYADTPLKIGEDLSDSQYLILTYSINPKMVQTTSSVNSSQNTSLIASFSGLIFQKGKMLPPEVDQADGSIQVDGAGGTYKGTVYIHFDNDTFLKGASDAVRFTDANLLTGEGTGNNLKPSNFGTHGGTVQVANYSPSDFELSFSGVQLNDTLRFPDRYFANLNNEEAKKSLSIRVTSKNNKIYLVVTWPGAADSPWEFPLTEDSTDYDLHIKGNGISDPRSPALVLTVPTAAKLTAEVIPELAVTLDYEWAIRDGSDIVTITQPDNSAAEPDRTQPQATFTPVRPGKTVVTVTATGRGQDNTLKTPSVEMPVTVKGEIDPITSNMVLLSSGGSYDPDTRTLTLYIKDSEGNKLAAVPSATVRITANGQDIAPSASISCATTGNIKYDANQTNGTILIQPTNTSVATGNATLSVKLVSNDGKSEDLTDPVTINVVLAQTPATPAGNDGDEDEPDTSSLFTTRPSKAPAQNPTLTVTGTNVNGSTLKVSGGKTAAVTANTTATGNIIWEIADKSVATVQKNGTNGATVTGVGIGTTTMTVSVEGTNLTKYLTVNVTGSVTNLTLATKSSNVAWNQTSKLLSLTRSSAGTSAKLTATASAKISTSAVVKCSVAKEDANYVIFEDGGGSSITVKPGSASAAADKKITVTVGLYTKDGTSLTENDYTYTVQVKGNDAGVNISGKLPTSRK